MRTRVFVSWSCLSVLLIISGNFKTIAQDRCGTVEYTKTLRDKNLLRENDKKFEQWLSQRKAASAFRMNAVSSYQIPVVVHVIHNGEAVGTGVNISDAQIHSQINVLNKDFKRLNADTTQTPGEFQSVAGKVNLEFVLAKQTPQGTPTNGIVRVKGSRAQWSIDNNNALKATSYWPAEDYLNIWVTDIASTVLGYAQFPVSDLPGLEDAEDNRLTDGVVLDYRIVGSNEDGAFNLTTNFNRGRTATHEVGHFFGLRHIWGDDGGECDGDGDYVGDTPNQGGNSTGCPTHPQISCSVKTMFQNYMDYTNDVCMNLYTKEQVERILTVLENSPRRASLLTSEGLFEPGLVHNDLGIKSIVSPAADECIGRVIPKIVVINKGLNDVTSASIQLSIDDEVVETNTFSFGPLTSQSEIEISFSPVQMSGGTISLDFDIVKTNSAPDGKTNDNSRSVLTTVPYQIALPFSEGFNALPSTWTISNVDKGTSWAIIPTGAVNNATNSAVYMDFFQSTADMKEKDVIITPVMDLRQATSPFLAFDVAYARYQQRSDGLEVYVFTDCTPDFAAENKIYSKYGSDLATVSSTSNAFLPANETQWRREVLDLRQWIGQSHVQFAFVAVNGKGNNIYVDNVAVRTDVTENISIKEITNPSPVLCANEVIPSLIVENKSAVAITSVDVIYAVNDGSSQTLSVTNNFNLPPGGQTTITLPPQTLAEGENAISFRVINPNGFGDTDTTDNRSRIKSIINHERDKIPLRHNFDAEETDWIIINPQGETNWETIITNYDNSLHCKRNESGSDEEDSWLVSPVLDFSETATASLFFDYAFRYKTIDSIKDPAQQVFKVLVSRDCGQTFDEVLWNADENLFSENQKADGVPASAADWKRQYISLNAFAGETNVRVAFVVSNSISGTLYIDNIEFFQSDDPTPLASTNLYTLYPNKLENTKSFHITFNLNDRQTVAYELVDVLGKQLGSKQLTDVLNQTYTVNIENASSGIYFVRLLIDEKYYVSRIVIAQ